jgi:MYXO-CTERM domain-containing protein
MTRRAVSPFVPSALALALLSVSATTASANSLGAPGRTQLGCTGGGCHMGGTAPSLTFDAPATVGLGETVDLTITVTGAQAGAAAPKAGIGIQAESGTLTADAAGRLKSLLGELVHSAPAEFEGDSVTFDFQWTAPATPGPVTIFAAGNSVNGDANITGDMSALVSATITVTEAGGGGGTGGTPDGTGGTPDGTGGAPIGPQPDAGTDDGTGDGSGGSDDGGGCQARPGVAPTSGLLAGLALLGLGLARRRRRL